MGLGGPRGAGGLAGRLGEVRVGLGGGSEEPGGGVTGGGMEPGGDRGWEISGEGRGKGPERGWVPSCERSVAPGGPGTRGEMGEGPRKDQVASASETSF